MAPPVRYRLEREIVIMARHENDPKSRQIHRLMDEVYREMFLLEVNRPGAEMGLALALLRAVIQSDSLVEEEEFRGWVKTICPVALQTIEESLKRGCAGCSTSRTVRNAKRVR